MSPPSSFTRRAQACGPAVVAAVFLSPGIARAFRVFDVEGGCGRAAVALAALMAVVAVQATVARTAGARAGTFAALVLATTPLPSLAASALADGAVGVLALALAFGGLAIGAFDGTATRARRGVAVAIGVGGLVLGGLARGAVVGVAVPCLAIGLAWALSGVAVPGYADRGGTAVGGAALALGGATALFALQVAASARDEDATACVLVLGAPCAAASGETFDAVLGHVAHAAFPWSALLPLSLASLAAPHATATAPASFDDPAERAATHLRLAVVVGLAVAYAAHAALAGAVGPSPFAGGPLVACAVGLALDALDRAPPARGAAVVVLAIGGLLARDFVEHPATALAALAGVVAPPGLAALVRPAPIAALCVVGASAGAILIPSLGARAFAGNVAMAGGIVAAAVMRVGVYDRIAALGSPAEALARYATLARHGEPLGVLGVAPRDAMRAGAVTPIVLADPTAAAAWLAEPGDRRFLAVSAELLPRVAARYRALTAPPRALPVLAPADATVMLATSSLLPGEVSASPLDAVWLTAPPAHVRPAAAVFGGALASEGWTLDGDLRAGHRARLALIFRVLAPVADRFCTFVHVDMSPTRLTAEHRDLGGVRLSELRAGDLVADTFDLDVPLRAMPGRYPIYAGVGVLPCTDDRRLAVSAGASDGHDRAPLGVVEVTR